MKTLINVTAEKFVEPKVRKVTKVAPIVKQVIQIINTKNKKLGETKSIKFSITKELIGTSLVKAKSVIYDYEYCLYLQNVFLYGEELLSISKLLINKGHHFYISSSFNKIGVLIITINVSQSNYDSEDKAAVKSMLGD